jgi:trimethylamine:corrinoid methyltransferase-like protein
MPAISLQPNLLDANRLAEIHEAAIDLAGSVGLLVNHRELLDRLAGRDGIRIEAGRVHFRGDKIEAALAAMRFPPAPPASQFAIISGAYILSVQDLETGRVRAATHQDLVELTRLGQQLGLCGSPPVRPLDVPEPLQEIAMYKAAWEYSPCQPYARPR